MSAWREFCVTLAQPLVVTFPDPHTGTWDIAMDQNSRQAIQLSGWLLVSLHSDSAEPEWKGAVGKVLVSQ